MSKTGVIRCLLSLLLAVYLGFALFITNDMEARAACKGFDIRIEQTPGSRGFVTTDEIRNLLKKWKLDNTDRPASEIDTHIIEHRLNAVDNIEQATVVRMPDNRIRIEITPMIPVARVFDYTGKSYYINREGKRLTANARFRLDVPIISGVFDNGNSPTELLPLIERISNDPEWNAIVAQIMVSPDKSRDIILVPMIRGHVINLGDTSAIDNKLSRIMTIYHKVLPLKGWEFYDTLSVKWGGQVVATRRLKSIPEPMILFDQAGETEEEDINSMLVSTTADTSAVSR